MSLLLELDTVDRVTPVAKKPSKDEEALKAGDKKAPGLQVFAVRLPPSVATQVKNVAGRLGLEEAQFLRMLILEKLPEYQERVKALGPGMTAPEDS